jgi:serine protease AprX
VIAVGGTESYESGGEKDYMGTWSSSGNKHRTPDIAAPGRSIVSFRVPQSMLDQMYPQAVVKDNYFKGTGTSQSVAVVSGFVAALLSANPSLTNDQVKFLFELFADDIAQGEYLDGSGKIDLKEVSKNTNYWEKAPVQVFDYAIPTKRDDGTVGPSTASNWSGGQWNGASWSGGTWSGASWSGASWSGASWSGGVWSGASWSGASWSGASWSGASWSGASWSGASWSGASWSGASWSGLSWSSAAWNEFAS